MALFGEWEKEIRRFQLEKDFYHRLIVNKKPREIYCVNSYGGLAPMIDAAKDAGVTVIELQHGTVSKSGPCMRVGWLSQGIVLGLTKAHECSGGTS